MEGTMGDIEALRAESERINQEYRASEAYTATTQGQLEAARKDLAAALSKLAASQAKLEISEAKWQADREALDTKWQADREKLIQRMDKYEKYRLSNLLSLALVWFKNTDLAPFT